MDEKRTLNYYVVNEQGKALSSYYSNDCKGQLHFRRTDAYGFSTIEEAEDFVAYIQRTCNTKTRHTADQLRVSTYAIGWPA